MRNRNREYFRGGYVHTAREVLFFDSPWFIYTVFQKSDAKIEIATTIRQILSELNILLAAFIIAFLASLFGTQCSFENAKFFFMSSLFAPFHHKICAETFFQIYRNIFHWNLDVFVQKPIAICMRNFAAGIMLLSFAVYLIFVCFSTACFWRNKDAYIFAVFSPKTGA